MLRPERKGPPVRGIPHLPAVTETEAVDGDHHGDDEDDECYDDHDDHDDDDIRIDLSSTWTRGGVRGIQKHPYSDVKNRTKCPLLYMCGDVY